jgi:hypothetical protein
MIPTDKDTGKPKMKPNECQRALKELRKKVSDDLLAKYADDHRAAVLARVHPARLPQPPDTRAINDETARRWTEDVCGDVWSPPTRSPLAGPGVQATTYVEAPSRVAVNDPVVIPRAVAGPPVIASSDMTEEPEEAEHRAQRGKRRSGIGS